MHLAFWVVLIALAWLVDRIVGKYWGKKGVKIATLLIAVYSIGIGMYRMELMDIAFGVFMLWSARPTRPVPSSTSQLPS